MKRVTFWLLSLVFGLTACTQQEDFELAGNEVNYKMNIGVDNGVQTRADNEFPNPDLVVNYKPRYIVEIYNNNVLYKRLVQSSNVVEFRLVTNQAYDFLVWVDYVNINDPENDLQDIHYNTTSLKSISLSGSYANNDESRDAFSYAFSKTAEEIGNQANNFDIVCTRPFGQLNITATDWNYTGNLLLLPTKVNISFTVYSEYNVLTGIASVPVTIPLTYTINQDLAGAVLSDGTTRKLTCDYILAPNTEAYVIPNTVLTFFNASGDVITNTGAMLINLPIQRNFKTNVSGMLLSKSGSATINVDAGWYQPSIDETIEDPQP